jgi:hypothetical protein
MKLKKAVLSVLGGIRRRQLSMILNLRGNLLCSSQDAVRRSSFRSLCLDWA